jgi:hypothetical protein
MFTTLHLICVESLNRFRAQTNEREGLTTTPSRCICYRVPAYMADWILLPK